LIEPSGRRSHVLKVTRSIELNFDDLPGQIAQAIADDPRYISEIAFKADIDRSYLYKLKNGFAPSVTEDTLKRLEAALGVDFGVTGALDDATLAAAGIG
jgi:transcriptional regulator with XRE-family HTH domain